MNKEETDPHNEELEDYQLSQSSSSSSNITTGRGLGRFINLVQEAQIEKRRLRELLEANKPELLRQLFMSYVVNRDNMFDKKKLVEGLCDGSFKEAATKQNII